MWSRLMIAVAVACAVLFYAAPAGAAERRLDYRQAQAAKDAAYYLDQVEGFIAGINATSANWKVGDPAVPINAVRNAVATKDRAAQYVRNVDTRLAALPAAHAEVAPLVQRQAAAKAALAGIEKRLADVEAGLQGVLKAGAAPEYKVDFDRLDEINRLFADPQVFRSHPQRAVATAKLIAPVAEERKRLAAKYADLMQQPTLEAKRMREVVAYFDQVYGAFSKAADAYAAAAPGEIDKNLADALRMADEAVAEKKHPFFGEQGGIKQALDEAQTRYEVLAAIAPDGPAAAKAAKQIEEMRAKVRTAAAGLNEAILGANRPPEEQYRGADLDALRAIVKEKWTKEGTGGQVQRLGISTAQWARDTRWEWNRSARAWEKVDKSRVQGFLVIVPKPGDAEAVVHYVNLVKDHLANDAIGAYFLYGPKEAPEVTRRVLVKNLK